MISRIEKLLAERNISSRKLLLSCDLSPSTLIMWKQGKGRIPVEALKKIADFLNVSVDYILGREEQKHDDLTEREKELLQNYRTLDFTEQAEIRGEIRGMIKAKEQITMTNKRNNA